MSLQGRWLVLIKSQVTSVQIIEWTAPATRNSAIVHCLKCYLRTFISGHRKSLPPPSSLASSLVCGETRRHHKPYIRSILPADPCRSPLDVGLCNSAIPKFYWKLSSGRCEPFSYSGCGGGANRFSSADECERVCSGTGPGQYQLLTTRPNRPSQLDFNFRNTIFVLQVSRTGLCSSVIK